MAHIKNFFSRKTTTDIMVQVGPGIWMNSTSPRRAS